MDKGPYYLISSASQVSKIGLAAALIYGRRRTTQMARAMQSSFQMSVCVCVCKGGVGKGVLLKEHSTTPFHGVGLQLEFHL